MFKQTSIFNVKSALANNHNLVTGSAGGGEELLPSDDELSDSEEWQYLRSFWSGVTRLATEAVSSPACLT